MIQKLTESWEEGMMEADRKLRGGLLTVQYIICVVNTFQPWFETLV